MVEGLYEKNRAYNLLILCSLNNEPRLPGDPHGEGEWLLSNEDGGRDSREASVELSLSQHYSQYEFILFLTSLDFFNTASQKARKIRLNFSKSI